VAIQQIDVRGVKLGQRPQFLDQNLLQAFRFLSGSNIQAAIRCSGVQHEHAQHHDGCDHLVKPLRHSGTIVFLIHARIGQIWS
jgi:hypothetical protein